MKRWMERKLQKAAVWVLRVFFREVPSPAPDRMHVESVVIRVRGRDQYGAMRVIEWRWPP